MMTTSIRTMRTVQYFKDRTECFDDYFPCRKINCNRLHVHYWLKMYIILFTYEYG